VRVLRLLSGAGLLIVAGLKVSAAMDSRLALSSQIAGVERFAAFLEVLVGLWLVLGWRPKFSALSLGLLGLTFAATRVAAKANEPWSGSCGCLGRFELTHRGAVVICSGMMISAAALLWQCERDSLCSVEESGG
jgi:hypothetical protein